MVRGQWANLARMAGLNPYSFSKDILGFLMTTESQVLGLTSHPKDYRGHPLIAAFTYLLNVSITSMLEPMDVYRDHEEMEGSLELGGLWPER